MKKIQNAPGIEADGDYAGGYKLKNGQTTVGEHINQDIVQFFQKLIADAGITPNGQFDNNVNGHQLIQALRALHYLKEEADDNSQNNIDASKISGLQYYEFRTKVVDTLDYSVYITVIGTSSNKMVTATAYIVGSNRSSSGTNINESYLGELMPSDYRPQPGGTDVRVSNKSGYNTWFAVDESGVWSFSNPNSEDEIVSLTYFVVNR
jgi:hypothetical protein